jgi:hypothetical protein
LPIKADGEETNVEDTWNISVTGECASAILIIINILRILKKFQIFRIILLQCSSIAEFLCNK